MALERCLILNADDFGRSPGINRGIHRGKNAATGA
jgi:predicted glycoside hydrolase/deacetylase ChbG (UPF0249 family)